MCVTNLKMSYHVARRCGNVHRTIIVNIESIIERSVRVVIVFVDIVVDHRCLFSIGCHSRRRSDMKNLVDPSEVINTSGNERGGEAPPHRSAS